MSPVPVNPKALLALVDAVINYLKSGAHGDGVALVPLPLQILNYTCFYGILDGLNLLILTSLILFSKEKALTIEWFYSLIPVT